MRTIRVKIYGYGGELTAGTLSDDTYMDMLDYDSENGIQNLEWYEMDDLVHAYGVHPDGAVIEVIDVDRDEIIYDGELGDLNGDPFDLDELYFEPTEDNIMVCLNSEKGLFFDGTIELSDDDEFDIENIKLTLKDVLIEDEVQDLSVGYEIVNEVIYNGDEIDNMGGETRGKSFDVHFFPKYEQ